jgi:hypothetical protein
LVKTDEKFKEIVLDIMDEEVIRKFDAREVDASNFYEEENSPQKAAQ